MPTQIASHSPMLNSLNIKSLTPELSRAGLDELLDCAVRAVWFAHKVVVVLPFILGFTN